MKTWVPVRLSLAALLASSSFCGSAAAQQTAAGGFTVRNRSAGQVITQDMKPFTLGTWEEDDQLFWTGAGPSDKLEVMLPVTTTGAQELSVVLTRASDYGIVQFFVDGTKVGKPIDLYCGYVTSTPPISLGTHEFREGTHTLTVEIVGTNEKTKGRSRFGLDQISLKPIAEADAATQTALTARIDELHRFEMLPRLRPKVRCKMFSSYDRTGGNNDGFGGVYSQLWIEDGNSVLAKMEGAGCIQRIWFTHSQYKTPGLLNLKREHIKVYLDGQEEPALDVPLEDLFSGKLTQFPSPLVGEGQGGYYCYVPIPYRAGCKVLVEGTGVRFYQITYRQFPSARDVSSFRMALSAEQQTSLTQAVRAWSRPGDLTALDLKDANEVTVNLALSRGESQTVDLPEGPGMVRAVFLDGEPGNLKNAVGGRLQCRWEGAQKTSVDLPVEYFFGQALDPPPYRSLLTGSTDQGWYNFLPMPYRQKASLTVTAAGPMNCSLRVVTVPMGRWRDDLCHLHAVYNEELPTQAGRHHRFLTRNGRGHYAGTYLVTQGRTERKLPLWLEGDDRFTIDGELAIHGTGSEDYFNCGWYAVEGRLNGAGGFPLHGFPVYRLVGDRNQAIAYRWHLTDPVAYESSIVAEMEHGADNTLPADYRSAAFFYEAEP